MLSITKSAFVVPLAAADALSYLFVVGQVAPLPLPPRGSSGPNVEPNPA